MELSLSKMLITIPFNTDFGNSGTLDDNSSPEVVTDGTSFSVHFDVEDEEWEAYASGLYAVFL